MICVVVSNTLMLILQLTGSFVLLVFFIFSWSWNNHWICFLYVFSSGTYHIHMHAACEYDVCDFGVHGHSPAIGFGLDGRMLYGMWEDTNTMPELDACNGHYGYLMMFLIISSVWFFLIRLFREFHSSSVWNVWFFFAVWVQFLKQPTWIVIIKP